eukprot:9037214-Pyramimonas_sp.AAC.1
MLPEPIHIQPVLRLHGPRHCPLLQQGQPAPVRLHGLLEVLAKAGLGTVQKRPLTPGADDPADGRGASARRGRSRPSATIGLPGEA